LQIESIYHSSETWAFDFQLSNGYRRKIEVKSLANEYLPPFKVYKKGSGLIRKID
jgi:hypothetical protein